MPYREKTAWLMLIAMAVTFGPYFGYVAITSPGEEVPNLRLLAWYAVAAISQLVILGIGHLTLRFNSPEDARVPPDERDRAISSRAMSFAYYLLIVGMMVVGCIMPFLERGWTLVNASLFTIATAQFVQYCVIVVSYRRQA